MKKLYIILGLTVTVLFSLHFQAQSQTCRFPAYSTTDYMLTMNMQTDSVSYFSPDSSHCVCDKVFSYDVVGMSPSDNDSRVIALTGGTANPTGVNTIPAAMCRLLKAFQNQSVTEVAQQYRPSDAETMNLLFSVDSIRTRYFTEVHKIQKMKLLFTVESGEYTFAEPTCPAVRQEPSARPLTQRPTFPRTLSREDSALSPYDNLLLSGYTLTYVLL